MVQEGSMRVNVYCCCMKESSTEESRWVGRWSGYNRNSRNGSSSSRCVAGLFQEHQLEQVPGGALGHWGKS